MSEVISAPAPLPDRREMRKDIDALQFEMKDLNTRFEAIKTRLETVFLCDAADKDLPRYKFENKLLKKIISCLVEDFKFPAD